MIKSRKKLKIIGAILTAFLLLGGLFLAKYLKAINDYQTQVSAIAFADIDISSVPDGVYTGEYDVNIIYAKVEVTVEEGEITSISLLEHRNGRGSPAEAIVGKIVREQTLDVDAVSSATNSSKVIRKAVENALRSDL